jgi:uncharacterized metal-binding protein YceD (DUF177 family)
MVIEFRKAPAIESPFEFKSDDLIFKGTFIKKNSKLVDIKGLISGTTKVVCNRCAKEFSINIDQEVELKLSDGPFSDESDSDLDDMIYETYDSKIDFNDILNSEIEAIRSDYHFCSECSDEDYEEEF